MIQAEMEAKLDETIQFNSLAVTLRVSVQCNTAIAWETAGRMIPQVKLESTL